MTRESIEQELELIREQGYSMTAGEATEGTTGIAAPIFSYENTVIGSLNCAGPTIRFTQANIEKYSYYTKKYAGLISGELGFRNASRINS
ncbi:Pectin degradation repressor protein KdgR [compost metagenome]